MKFYPLNLLGKNKYASSIRLIFIVHALEVKESKKNKSLMVPVVK